MQTSAETRSIRREITIAASPEMVWDCLVDPDKATRWMGQSADFDARPGGRYRVEVIPGVVAMGELVELDRPRRLVWTWGSQEGGTSGVAAGSTTVEIELIPEGEGTLVRLDHHGLPSDDSVRAHAHGWDHYLERLAVVGRGHDPGADPWIDGMT